MTNTIDYQTTTTLPQHPTTEQTAEIINLWRYCFQDSEAFIQWYFTDCYTPEQTYLLQAKDQELVAAALQSRPYTLHIRGTEFPAAYLAGVCTHPAYRGDGYFRQLFPAVLQQLAQKGMAIAFLQPIDNLLYQPYDFAFTHYRQDYCLTMTDIASLAKKGAANAQEYTITLITEPEKYWYLYQEIYRTYHSNHHGYACRTEDNWREHLTDWQLDQGHIALFSYQNQATAYLVYRLEGSKLEILEMAYQRPADYQAIWHYIYGHRTQAEQICWSAPMEDKLLETIPHWQGKCNLHPDVMTRILSVESLLSHVTYPRDFTGILWLTITDDIIPANNGTFSLSIHQGTAAIRKMAYTPNAYCSLSIKDLTALIMGQASALELVEQGQLTGIENQIHALEKLFPKKKNTINESF
ncbi:MAG: GNAT family N-acetyltransferase [Peptococcaceae bacterium]|jgi:predicted acetyltransferase|nr:GNAT family N-acetyltransferase [Peptococcaceae bacterium]